MLNVDKLIKSHNDHLLVIKSLQSELEVKSKDASTLKERLSNELNVAKLNNDRNQQSILEIEQRDMKSINMLKEATQSMDNAKAKIAECEEKDILLNEKMNKINAMDSQLQSKTNDLNKREAWIEMEERRLIFLNRKIEIISQDKEIQAKLKEFA